MTEDIKYLEKMVERVSDSIEKQNTVLDRVADNLKQINDDNVLHTAETRENFKVLNNWIMRLIILLVIILGIVAGAEKILQLFPLPI
ncbi:hypothetical protein [Oceanihabitans sediminis]|uniref:hypothetical protein n=1 Tax=Oceanihabitans sediminis TaxID=1812012 RepID=UPI00299E9C1B|nr:hypothetical protein [Oceanihabitans sediminis]MDX1279014.1 hypothetical protein [Oceanihabitans sediminis]